MIGIDVMDEMRMAQIAEENKSVRERAIARLMESAGKDKSSLPSTLEYKSQVPMTGVDPLALSPRDVVSISVKVRGKLQYRGPLNTRIGKLLAILAREYGRKLVVTCRMADGRTHRHRGNGSELLDRVKHRKPVLM